METQYIHFSVEGEFITNLARKQFYQDHNLGAAIKLLMECLETDELSEEERLMLCMKILNGNAKIVGTYPNDDYGIQECENKEEPFSFLIDEINQMAQKIKQLEEESHLNLQKFLAVLDFLDLSEYQLRELNNKYYNEYGDTLFPELKSNYSNANLQLLDKWNQDTPTDNDPVQSYINHIKNQKDDDYGWLEPDGTYHPVEWANHFKWAQEYLDEHYPYKDNAHIYWRKDENGKRRHIVGGDCLVYHFHWVLLHSPYQGTARPTYDTAFGLTKAQKEFLYEYYIARNMHKEANALYADDK